MNTTQMFHSKLQHNPMDYSYEALDTISQAKANANSKSLPLLPQFPLNAHSQSFRSSPLIGACLHLVRSKGFDHQHHNP